MIDKTPEVLRRLQVLVGAHFGKKRVAPNEDTGASTISISNSRIELTDEEGMIVAKGPVRVAKVLRTRRIK